MELLKPPQAVIYTRDMEPITVIDMRPWYWEQLYRQGVIRFAVTAPLRHMDYHPDERYPKPWDVTIRASLINTNNRGWLLLNTDDEATALAMKSSFMSGQIARLSEERKKAFAQGFIKAMSLMGER